MVTFQLYGDKCLNSITKPRFFRLCFCKLHKQSVVWEMSIFASFLKPPSQTCKWCFIFSTNNNNEILYVVFIINKVWKDKNVSAFNNRERRKWYAVIDMCCIFSKYCRRSKIVQHCHISLASLAAGLHLSFTVIMGLSAAHLCFKHKVIRALHSSALYV